MIIGPVFTREAVTAPRRGRFFFYRSLYVAGLLLLMCTAWLVLAGTQVIRNVGDIARFGSVLFQILTPLQLALVVFLSAILAAGAVAQEKDRKTLILLLMTRMSNSELVLGKLLASLLNVLVMLAAALPLFAFLVVLGGVSFAQVARVFAVTVVTALAAGSLGSTIALWREKTFQTLSMTALGLVFWLGVWEVVALFGSTTVLGVSCESWATGFSPLQAVLAAASPILPTEEALGPLSSGVNLFVLVGAAVTLLLNGVAINRVRVWNPTREVRMGQEQEKAAVSIWGVEHDLEKEQDATSAKAEAARSEHVDARVKQGSGKSRQVWDNPVLWREMCTWAYGRKVLVIRLAYLVLFAFAALGLHWSLASETVRGGNELATIIPEAAKPLVPFFLVSMVIVNALAVTSITNERDGRSLDILLVTDLSPREFIFGKLGGVMWVTREMIALPMMLCVYLWLRGGVSLESLIYILGGLAVLYLFVATLGVHCGMIYANSRTAISVSMGTVFFLFMGVVTCILMMISFSGSFQTQFYPFAALILGGGVGLFVALGARNPSAAIGAASLLLPFATFYAIVSFVLDYTLPVFLVIGAVYGFTTAAMLVPALGEFNIAMGRARTAAEDE
ncbi:MAG: ABC transporter permease subunit [Pirellulaceae bacterium]